MEKTIVTCLNCGDDYEGDFCPSCGQSASTGKFTWRSLFHNFLRAWDFERGILYIFRELWLHPRQLILGYIEGKRVNVYPPVKYMLFSVAIVAALHLIYKAEDLGTAEVIIDGVEKKIDLWTSTNLSIFHLIVLPFYALTTRTFFRKWRLTLPEHFVLNMFVLGQVNCLEFVVLSIFYKVPVIAKYSTILSMILPAYFYFMMCKPRTVGSLFKAITAGLLALGMFLLTILVLTVVFMFITNGALALAPK